MTHRDWLVFGHWGLLIGPFFHRQCNIEWGQANKGPKCYNPKIMTTDKKQTWLPVALIAGALLIWMGLLAAGAYWAPVGLADGGEGPQKGDFRKLWVVSATTGCFLLLWGFVLYRLQVKLRRRRIAAEEVDSEGREGHKTAIR